MTTKLSLLGYSKDGFKVSVSVEADTVLDAAAEYTKVQKYAEQEGWVADGMHLAATKTLASAPQNFNPTREVRIRTDGKPDEGGIRCRIDGQEVQAFSGYGKSYTAQELADSRSKKMVEMGEPAGPVCGDCWTGGGWKAKSQAAYEARQSARR